MYSLWRGDVLLGRIAPELPSDNDHSVFGMLDPSAAFLPGQAMSQHVMVNWPGAPVFQHVDSPVVVGAGTRQQHLGSAGPRQLAEAIRDSVPIDRQLSLRDTTETHIVTRTILISTMPHAGHSMQEMCRAAGVRFSGWCVVAKLATPARDAR